MDICRLCLQNGADFIPNFQEIFHVLQNFLPYINSLQSLNTKVCDICLKTIQIISDLKKSPNLTNNKTGTQEEMPGTDKSNPTGVLDLVQTMNEPVKKVCKICLTVVNNPKIFLYENQFNILQHDMILYMFQFCNLKLNYDLSEKPVMCYQCWENLQVCFSFKKNYLEIDKKIRAYCNLSNISVKNISGQILREMVKHFLDHDGEIHIDMQAMIKEEIFCDDSTKRYSLRKRVKKENGDENGDCISHVKKKMSKPKIKKESTGAPRGAPIPKRNSSCFTTKRNRHDFTKPNRHYFTKEDDDLLDKIYWKLKNDNNTPMKVIWKQAHDEFNKSSSLDLSQSSVTGRIRRILANKNKNPVQTQAPKLKDEELKMDNVFVPLNVDQDTDSDDSFLDEVKPSSFMPTVKLEPLSDDEIHIIEPKTEPLDIPPSDVDSDLESLPIPLLERMDLPPLNFQIKDIYSIEVKKETLNMITANGDADPNLDNFNSCMRVMLSDSTNETTYKCMECHFETKYQYASKCHSDWHANSSKKRFECKHCTFVTSKFFLLKHHLSTSHEKENEEKYDSDDGINMDNFEMELEDCDECTPPEISEAAKITSLKLLPEKSKTRYTYTYDQFMEWRKEKNIKTSFSEDVLLAYIDQMSQKVKPTTLWTQYSMLRSTLYIHHNVDISKYVKLKAYLKSANDGYEPKKAKVLTSEQINQFLNKAPDNDYLLTKVALIVGISGACRKQELIQITMDDIEDLGSAAIIALKGTKNKTSRKFTITGDFYGIFKKYLNLRPNIINEKRFFLNYQKARCTRQVVGINKIGSVPKEVAKFLKLENPNLYTGHCFRRSSATILVDAGEDITSLKRHGGWKSSNVAEGYIEDSIKKRLEISNKIVQAVAGPSKAAPSTSCPATIVTEKNILTETCLENIENSGELNELNVHENIQNTLLTHNVSQTPINFNNCSNNHFVFNFYAKN